MRTVSRKSSLVAAGKLCALALAVLAAPVAGRPAPPSGPTAAGARATTQAAAVCRPTWPSASCAGAAGEPARRVRVIAIGAGSAGPLPR